MSSGTSEPRLLWGPQVVRLVPREGSKEHARFTDTEICILPPCQVERRA